MKFILSQTFPGKDCTELCAISFKELFNYVPCNIKKEDLILKFSLTHWSNSVDINIDFYQKSKYQKSKCKNKKSKCKNKVIK